MSHDLSIGDRLLREGVDAGVFTHAVYALAVDGNVVAIQAFGQAEVDTIFDLASLTKPMSTATLLLQSVERGELHLGQRAADFFDKVDSAAARKNLGDIALLHLATHTSGLPPVPDWPPPFESLTHADFIRSTLGTMPLHAPGAAYRYSDVGYILLGEIIPAAAGAPLEKLFQDRIAAPAGLTSTGFTPVPSVYARIAPTSTWGVDGRVHDPRAQDLGGIAGHAGLFGTAADVLTYLEVIRKGGSPLLSGASTACMAVSRIDPAVGAHSIGWFCAGNDLLPRGDLFSDRSFGHSGFTGAVALIDPEYAVSLVLLTNRVIGGEDNRRYLLLRRKWTNAVAAAVTRG